MKIAHTSVALALAGAMTVAAVTPSAARSWRPWAAAGAGVAAGAIIGSAIAAGAYGPRYSYAPGYGAYAAPYDGYAAPGYGAYAYAPDSYYAVDDYAATYRVPSQYGHYDSGYKSCATDGQYNRTDYSAC